jgi:hypothetical protein
MGGSGGLRTQSTSSHIGKVPSAPVSQFQQYYTIQAGVGGTVTGPSQGVPMPPLQHYILKRQGRRGMEYSHFLPPDIRSPAFLGPIITLKLYYLSRDRGHSQGG